MSDKEFDFEATHDWYYLAKYFDLEVSKKEVRKTWKRLKKFDLIVDSPVECFEEDSPASEVMFWNKDDLREYLLREKLKEYIWEEIISELGISKGDPNKEAMRAVRAFTEQFCEASVVKGTVFWEKLLEADNDYVFYVYLINNIESLWF